MLQALNRWENDRLVRSSQLTASDGAGGTAIASATTPAELAKLQTDLPGQPCQVSLLFGHVAAAAGGASDLEDPSPYALGLCRGLAFCNDFAFRLAKSC